MTGLNIIIGLLILIVAIYLLFRGIRTLYLFSRGKQRLYAFDLAELVNGQEVQLSANTQYAIYYQGKRRRSTKLRWQPYISGAAQPEQRISPVWIPSSYANLDVPSKQTYAVRMFTFRVPQSGHYQLRWKLSELGWQYPFSRWLASDTSPPIQGEIEVYITEAVRPLSMLWIPFGMFFGMSGIIVSIFVITGIWYELAEKYVFPSSIWQTLRYYLHF